MFAGCGRIEGKLLRRFVFAFSIQCIRVLTVPFGGILSSPCTFSVILSFCSFPSLASPRSSSSAAEASSFLPLYSLLLFSFLRAFPFFTFVSLSWVQFSSALFCSVLFRCNVFSSLASNRIFPSSFPSFSGFHSFSVALLLLLCVCSLVRRFARFYCIHSCPEILILFRLHEYCMLCFMNLCLWLDLNVDKQPEGF